jgi:phage-related protein
MPNYNPFVGFTYNGKHSIDDLHIYRTSNSGRYTDNLTATMTDKTVDVPGGNGQYYFGTTYKNKTFTVNYAFDKLTKAELDNLRETFSGDGIHDLVFDEDRNTSGTALKTWSAKVTGTAQIKYLCFEEEVDAEGNSIDIYKGEGSIVFTCYFPFARKKQTQEFAGGSGTHFISIGGQKPTTFKAVCENLGAGQITIGSLTINTGGARTFTWDSSTGLVLANNAPIAYTGVGYGTINVGTTEISYAASGSTKVKIEWNELYI